MAAAPRPRTGRRAAAMFQPPPSGYNTNEPNNRTEGTIMGADLLSITVVRDTTIDCELDPIKQYLADPGNVARIIANSEYLRNELENYSDSEEDDIPTATERLIEGAESFILGMRTHNIVPMGHDLELIVAGGMSWGDDPYDGFSAEATFIEAAGDDPGLNTLVGIVGGPEIDTINTYLAKKNGGNA